MLGIGLTLTRPANAPPVTVAEALDVSFLTGTLDARVTPTLRAGSGTAAAGWQFDSSGALVLGTHNLCLQSETFDNASWTKTRASVTANATTAPDGALAADKIVEDGTASATHFATQNVTSVGSTTYTFSVFVKAAGRNFVLVQVGNFAVQVASNAIYVNLATGAFAATDAARTSVTAVGDGWYRVSSRITTIPAGGTIQPSVYPAAVSGTNIYSGDGSSGVYVWGAQLDVSRDLRPYVPSTTAAVYGGARIGYDPATLAVSGLLIEPAATNLFLNSAVGATQDVTVTAAAHTLSFYGTGTITLTGTSTAGPLVGTGATARATLTFTPTAGALTCTVSGTVTNAQLELGSAATSPIVTVGSAVTRPADSAKMLSLSWMDAARGTFLVDAILNSSAASKNILSVSDNTSNEIIQLNTTSGGAPRLSVTDGGAAQAATVSGFTVTAGTAFRVAGAYAANDFAVCAGGGTVGTDTSGTLPTPDRLYLGASGTGTVTAGMVARRLRYYAIRKANGEMIALTTA